MTGEAEIRDWIRAWTFDKGSPGSSCGHFSVEGEQREILLQSWSLRRKTSQVVHLDNGLILSEGEGGSHREPDKHPLPISFLCSPEASSRRHPGPCFIAGIFRPQTGPRDAKGGREPLKVWITPNHNGLQATRGFLFPGPVQKWGLFLFCLEAHSASTCASTSDNNPELSLAACTDQMIEF